MSDVTYAAGVVLVGVSSDCRVRLWLIGGEVWRTVGEAPADTMGYPMGTRWECTFAQWQRFRDSAYAWALDPDATMVDLMY